MNLFRRNQEAADPGLQPYFPEHAQLRSMSPPSEGDLYLDSCGGIGSRRADELAAQNEAVQARRREAVRQARRQQQAADADKDIGWSNLS
jgi:hypothetical protein